MKFRAADLFTDRHAIASWIFWPLALALIAARLIVTSDLSVQIIFSPHDDSLYVTRAFELIEGNGFGPYDSRVLVKYPGISLWLAIVRILGIPFLVSVNVLYIASGIYVMTGLLRCGLGRMTAWLAFALFLFNPITFGYEWIRVLREPLDTGLWVVLLGAALHMWAAFRQQKLPLPHLVVFSVVFAYSLYVREENRLLWGLPVLLALAAVADARFRGALGHRAIRAGIAGAFALPVLAGLAAGAAWHAFAERHYGMPVVHEFSEGEFPGLIAAMRSIESTKDNRMVMVTQEALARLKTEVPMLAPVIVRLPQPGPDTLSCRIHGVCSEWSNGWMLFWIKDSAFEAGLTPDLPTAQAFFGKAREEIERACREQRLRCTPRGSGLVPPIELRWTRAFVTEWWRLAKTAFSPAPNVVVSPPVIYPVQNDLGRVYQAVTMTDYFDTERQRSFKEVPARRPYVSPLGYLRDRLGEPYQQVMTWVSVAALAALLVGLVSRGGQGLSAFAVVAVVFVGFLVLRLSAVAYVAVYMGAFDPRMMFSTYALLVLIAVPLLVEGTTALRLRMRVGKAFQ